MLAAGSVSACMRGLLVPEDRTHVCQVAVEDKSDSPVFHANPLSSPAGGLVGAGEGALGGLLYGGGSLLTLITLPIGAVIGAAGGTACAAASLNHPTAEADFEMLLQAASRGALRDALEADSSAPRPACRSTTGDASAVTAVDTIVEIEKIDAGMACAFGKQEYWISVKWRAMTATTHRVLGETTTRCSQTSFLDVDEWFADPDQALVEIERVLAATGRRMARQLVSSGGPLECKFRSTMSGEIEER
jgi:hypothetical protein